MDVSQLRTLIHVAELGSLSKAADRVCTAQPALSRQIRLLEEELGTRLFDRHGRGMVLTEQGRIVLEHAQRVISELEFIKSSVADSTSLRGRVSIGLPPTVAEVLSVPLISALRAAHPQVTCRIVSAYSLYLFDWIHHGDLDIAVMYDPHSIRSLKSEPFLEESLYVVGAADAGFNLNKPVPFKSLQGKPLILPSQDHSLRQIVDQFAHQCGFSVDVKVEANALTDLRRLVENGAGWTVLPIAALHDDIEQNRISAAPLTDPAPTRRLELCLPNDRPVSRLTSFVRQTMLSTLADINRRGHWRGVVKRQTQPPPRRRRDASTDAPDR